MQPELLYADFPRYEELPDDSGELDALLGMVDGALVLDGRHIWSQAGLTVPLSEEAQKPGRKPWKIILDVLFYGLLAFLVAGAFLLSRGDKKPVFGYSFANVLTWSMEPEIPQGSLVVILQVDPDTIQIGDDITFMVDAETSVTHRVIGIRESFEEGARGFETQGINNETPDFEIVPASNVAGKVVFHVALVGNWLDWLRTHLWLTLGFAAGGVLLLVLLKGALKKTPAESEKKKPGRTRRRCPAPMTV